MDDLQIPDVCQARILRKKYTVACKQPGHINVFGIPLCEHHWLQAAEHDGLLIEWMESFLNKEAYAAALDFIKNQHEDIAPMQF